MLVATFIANTIRFIIRHLLKITVLIKFANPLYTIASYIITIYIDILHELKLLLIILYNHRWYNVLIKLRTKC